MDLYLAGNFVIMGSKEKEKAFQESLEHNCFRLAAFFYKKEIDIVTELKGEEQNESKEKVNKEYKTTTKRIRKRPNRRVKIIRKKKRT